MNRTRCHIIATASSAQRKPHFDKIAFVWLYVLQELNHYKLVGGKNSTAATSIWIRHSVRQKANTFHQRGGASVFLLMDYFFPFIWHRLIGCNE